MKFVDPRDFTGSRAWEALDIAEIDGATVRLHWADRPYDWHANDGDEVFVVLDGAVDMHFRETDGEHVRAMAAGDIFYAGAGVEHVAHPAPEARILVIERKGSV